MTLDVTQHYTHISNTARLHVAKEALGELRPNPMVKPSNHSLVHLMEFVQTNNKFHFNGNHYLHYLALSWVPKWHQHKPMCSWANSKKILSTFTTPHLYRGSASSMTVTFEGSLKEGHITTDLYKLTDSHTYLLYSSAHPKRCKDSIPYSQYLRINQTNLQ